MHHRQVLAAGRKGGFSLSERFDSMQQRPRVVRGRGAGRGAATYRGARQQRANRQTNSARNNRQQNLQQRRRNQNRNNTRNNTNVGKRGGGGRGRGRGRAGRGRGRGRGRGGKARNTQNKGNKGNKGNTGKRASEMSAAERQREANKLDKQMLEYNLKQIDSQEDLDDTAKEAKKKAIQGQFDTEMEERRAAVTATKHAALDDEMEAYFKKKPAKAAEAEAPAEAEAEAATADGEPEDETTLEEL